jgi:hypothetical protein
MMDTQDELLTHILYAAACIEERKDQLRLTTHNLHTRVAEHIAVDGFSNIFCEM